MSTINLKIKADKEILKGLMNEFNCTSYKDLMNNALTLLDWAGKKLKDGKEIASVDAGQTSYPVLQMPIFDSVRKTSPRP